MYYNVKALILSNGDKKPKSMNFLFLAGSYTEAELLALDKLKEYGDVKSIDTISKTNIIDNVRSDNGGETYYKVKITFGVEKPITEVYLVRANAINKVESVIKDVIEYDTILSIEATNIVEVYG